MKVVRADYLDDTSTRVFTPTNVAPFLRLQGNGEAIDRLGRVEPFLFLEFRRGSAIVQVVKNRFCRRFEAPDADGDWIIERLAFERDAEGNMQVTEVSYVGVAAPVRAVFRDLIADNMDLTSYDSLSGVDVFTIIEFKSGGRIRQTVKPKFCPHFVPA